MKVEVDLNDEFVELAMAAALHDQIEYFKSAGNKMAIFSFDKKEEKAEIKRYIEAFKLVHNWYVPPSLHIK